MENQSNYETYFDTHLKATRRTKKFTTYHACLLYVLSTNIFLYKIQLFCYVILFYFFFITVSSLSSKDGGTIIWLKNVLDSSAEVSCLPSSGVSIINSERVKIKNNVIIREARNIHFVKIKFSPLFKISDFAIATV